MLFFRSLKVLQIITTSKLENWFTCLSQRSICKKAKEQDGQEKPHLVKDARQAQGKIEGSANFFVRYIVSTSIFIHKSIFKKKF